LHIICFSLLEEGAFELLWGFGNFCWLWLFCFYCWLNWRFNFRCFDRCLGLRSWCYYWYWGRFRDNNGSFKRLWLFHISRLSCCLLKEGTVEFFGSRSIRKFDSSKRIFRGVVRRIFFHPVASINLFRRFFLNSWRDGLSLRLRLQ